MKRQTITAARLFVHVTVVSGPYAAVRRRASPTNQKPHSEARVLTDREPGEGEKEEKEKADRTSYSGQLTG
jgi:hypothetical protein